MSNGSKQYPIVEDGFVKMSPHDHLWKRYTSPTFGTQTSYRYDVLPDPKPWATWPMGESFQDAVKVAWGATAYESSARWGALYYRAQRRHEHAGRTDMINREKVSSWSTREKVSS